MKTIRKAILTNKELAAAVLGLSVMAARMGGNFTPQADVVLYAAAAGALAKAGLTVLPKIEAIWGERLHKN
jgi:hypothetical protein